MSQSPQTARSENSLLVSLKELRSIETDRVDREHEDQKLLVQQELEAREAEERAVWEREQEREREQDRQRQQEQARRERMDREERLRLAEAERRARVEAELELERRRVEMNIGAREGSRMPWLVTVVMTLALGGGVALLGNRLHSESRENKILLAQLGETQQQAAHRQRTDYRRIVSLNDQIGRLQSKLIEVIRREPKVIKGHSPRAVIRRRPRTKKKERPSRALLSAECLQSDDPLSPACVGTKK